MEITLEYWNTLANQFILICSLLSGFSVTIVANLISSEKNNRIINHILKLATVAAGCFLIALFAMTQMSMITTPGGFLKNIDESNFTFPKIIGFLSFILGLMALTAILCFSGWSKSKKTGIFTTIIGILAFCLLFVTMVTFNT